MLSSLRSVIGLCLLALCLLVVPSAAVAQHASARSLAGEREPADPAPVASAAVKPQRLSRMAGEIASRIAAQPGRSSDSLANGTLVGAAVGAVALGAFAAIICQAQQQPGGPSCGPDVVRIAAVGAAIGAGAGLAVDAARSRHGGVTLSLGVRF